MDDAPPASAPKKRRRDEPDPQDSPASRDVSGGGEEDLDLIGRLPDEILGSIISLLPGAKEAARTAILSSRWRYIWRSTPLNLVVDNRLSGQEHNRIAIVSKILAAHPGPARRLFLDSIRLGRDRYAKFDGWLRSSALDGLEELDFTFPRHQGGTRPLRPLPPSVLRFAATLRAASIGCCDFPEIDAGPALLLPRLKQLSLYDLAISEAAIHRLLAGCIVLEGLQLQSIRGLCTVRIASPTLRSIGVSAGSSEADEFQELVIEDAPCLERLTVVPFCGNGPRTIRVIAAPKLMVLGYVSTKNFKPMEMIPINFTVPMRTVKILAIESAGPNLDEVVGFLRCFPCTEKLYIKSSLRKDMKNVWQHDPLDPIECVDLHLRKIVLDGYAGMRPDVNFAKFFVLNSRVLKAMTFGLSGNCTEKWIANQHRRLQLDKRASIEARFDFKGFYGYRTQSIHGMRMPDPFDR